MSSTLGVRSVVASAFCVLDRYTSERFGRLRSTRGEGACGVSTHLSKEVTFLLQHSCFISETFDVKSETVGLAEVNGSHL
jgi:hypothetical protein